MCRASPTLYQIMMTMRVFYPLDSLDKQMVTCKFNASMPLLLIKGHRYRSYHSVRVSDNETHLVARSYENGQVNEDPFFILVLTHSPIWVKAIAKANSYTFLILEQSVITPLVLYTDLSRIWVFKKNYELVCDWNRELGQQISDTSLTFTNDKVTKWRHRQWNW